MSRARLAAALLFAPAALCLLSAAGLPEPCSLLTQAEVETALGKGATMRHSDNPRTGMSECRLEGPSVKVKRVIVVIHPGDLFAASKKQLMELGTDVKSVSGLGDDAYAGRGVGYNVRKGNHWVQVFGPVTNNDAENDKATRYLAGRAASRL